MSDRIMIYTYTHVHILGEKVESQSDHNNRQRSVRKKP